MKRNILAATAFASGTPAAATAKKAGAPKAAERVATAFTAVRNDIPMPATVRGGKSELAEKLATLEVGQSIGIANKTKEQISSKISKINNAADNTREIDVPGEPVLDMNGAVVGHGPATKHKETVKEFRAFNVDAKTDPDNATVRIFRYK